MSKVKNFLKGAKQPVLVSVILMIICGLIFPLFLTGIAQLVFPSKANGSIIEINGVKVGSENVGQQFTKPYFMKGRPSAVQYNTYVLDEDGNKIYIDGGSFGGVSSGSNNYGPSSEDLKERVEKDIEEFLKNNPTIKREDIPADLVTASGSGLDPHISVKSAEIQIPAIAVASGLSTEELNKIVKDNTEGKVLGIFGEKRVNVLGVNIDIAKKMGII